MSDLTRLKSAKSRKDLARILGYTPSAFTSIIYITPSASKFTTFTIKKKSGGVRIIKAPISKLKLLQSRLSRVLYESLEEIESASPRKPISFGFRRGRSIVENAARHKRRRWVLNLDIEDFFPCFNFGRVRGFFMKDKAFELEPEVATTIAQIACDGSSLPQGSPCSPIISELIAQILDMRLVRLAKQHRLTYSRYADDITFSTNQKEFPSAIAYPDPGDKSVWHLGTVLSGAISSSGFSVNVKKTRMHIRGSRQTVTGLTVNEKVNIDSKYYRRVRAMTHNLLEKGKYFKEFLPPPAPGSAPKPNYKNKTNILEGMIQHVYSITQSEDQRNVQEQRQKPRAIRTLYRRFLFYKYFLSLEKTLIVTEGKTDPIYLREAIKRCTRFHPILGQSSTSGFIQNVNYFNYGGLAHEILDLGGGGTSNLKSIPIDYQRNLYPYKKEKRAIMHRPMRFPVILLLDNDEGLSAITSIIKEKFKVVITHKSTDDFYHITDNLYVVKIPEDASKSTSIEDLFPDSVKNTKLNGKKFNPSNNIDISNEYSKEIFAKSVVRPNAAVIDFSGFEPLLDRIEKAITHYSAR